MKKFAVVMIGAMVGLFLTACNNCPITTCPIGGDAVEVVDGDKTAVCPATGVCPKGSTQCKLKSAGAVKLCGSCGEIKGTANCCKKDAEKCSKCELIKGSPGCCKMTKGETVKLCSSCGEIKGTTKCCKKDAVKCTKCNLIKGSPACCKLPKK